MKKTTLECCTGMSRTHAHANVSPLVLEFIGVQKIQIIRNESGKSGNAGASLSVRISFKIALDHNVRMRTIIAQKNKTRNVYTGHIRRIGHIHSNNKYSRDSRASDKLEPTSTTVERIDSSNDFQMPSDSVVCSNDKSQNCNDDLRVGDGAISRNHLNAYLWIDIYFYELHLSGGFDRAMQHIRHIRQKSLRKYARIANVPLCPAKFMFCGKLVWGRAHAVGWFAARSYPTAAMGCCAVH